jgi:hypothetical protein
MIDRRALGLVGAMLALSACGLDSQLAPGTASCQPFGYPPAQVPFPVEPGPVTSEAAEERAVALFRACAQPGSVIAELTSGSEAASGITAGPNDGQSVWRVQVDAMVTEPSHGATYRSHFIIEVNQATGIPTVVAYG